MPIAKTKKAEAIEEMKTYMRYLKRHIGYIEKGIEKENILDQFLDEENCKESIRKSIRYLTWIDSLV